jgi:hypothetical protein
MIAAHLDPYKTKVLVKEHHDRLVADLDSYSKDAGIQPYWVWTPLADTCGPEEIDYVRKFNLLRAEGEVQGLCLVRKTSKADPEKRMAALAGAFVRNFVRARVMSLGTVLDAVVKGDPPDATVLLIPNFFLSKDEGGTLSSWQVTSLYDLLVRRGQAGLHTVIFASGLNALGKDYGMAFNRLVEAHFVQADI